MKRTAKAFICILISLILLATAFIPAAAEKPQKAYPIVYLLGQAPSELKNANGEIANCGDYPEGYITEAVNDCLPYLKNAILKSEWDAYYAALLSWISPLYDEVRLNSSGEPINGTGIVWSWSKGSLPMNIRNEYGLNNYSYKYDWRLDPCYNASILSEYVLDVCRATGSDKINIIGRCEGACVLDAYIAEYGTDRINRIIYYTSADGGVDAIGDALSGNIVLDSDAIERWSANSLNLGDDFLNEFLSATIIAAENTGLLKLAGWGVKQFYELKLKQILPEIILATYGTMPSVWAMTDETTTLDALNFVFEGKEQEYAGLIEKIENYYYNVRLDRNERLLEAEDGGIGIGIIAKYGYQIMPFGTSCDELSDGSCLLRHLSKGATCTDVGKIFNKSYVQEARLRGEEDCISPDLQVDASTCLFKDTTWFVKYAEHRVFPISLDLLMKTFFETEELMTVDSFDLYPRFMVYDNATGALHEMTAENSADETWDSFTDVGYFTSIVRFFRLLIQLIRNYFDSVLPARA